MRVYRANLSSVFPVNARLRHYSHCSIKSTSCREARTSCLLSYIMITRPLIYLPCFLQAAHAAAINVTSVATTLLTRKLRATGGHKYKRILSFLFIAVFSMLSIVITDAASTKTRWDASQRTYRMFKHNHLNYSNPIFAIDVNLFPLSRPCQRSVSLKKFSGFRSTARG